MQWATEHAGNSGQTISPIFGPGLSNSSLIHPLKYWALHLMIPRLFLVKIDPMSGLNHKPEDFCYAVILIGLWDWHILLK